MGAAGSRSSKDGMMLFVSMGVAVEVRLNGMEPEALNENPDPEPGPKAAALECRTGGCHC